MHDDMLRELVARMGLDDKLRLITGEDVWSLPALPQIGLRRIRMSDGPVGVRGTSIDEGDTTLLTPNPSAQAAAFDPAVAGTAGRLLGAQSRAKDIQVLLAPTVNMHRSPRGGRHFECYSEDPLLTARTAAAFIEGVQSAGVAATVKHFVANDSENERMTYDVRADERTLRETYLVPFAAAVNDARAWLVMSAYNGVNGHTMTENAPLQNGILKDEWGFDGVVVSDWTAVRSTGAAYLGGTDIAMPGPDAQWGEPLREAIASGALDVAVLDDKVLRILRLAARVGALGDETPAVAIPDDAEEQLREIAARTMVLLENGGALPIDRERVRRVALIGPNATQLSAQGGGSAMCFPEHVTEIPGALREALGPDVELTVREGAFTRRRLPRLSKVHARDPETGEPGVRVEFRAVDGSLIESRHQVGAFVLMWMGLFPEGTAGIVVRTRIVPSADGDHLMDVVCNGSVRLTLDGERRMLELTPLDDIMEGLSKPPLERLTVPAKAGVPIDVTLEFGGESELLVASLGLNWAPPRLDEETEMREAVAAAAAADVAVVVVGTTDEIESEGFDRTDLRLPGRSDELVSRVAAVNPRTVVVVNAGSPVLMPWRHEVAAVLWAWLPGQEGGAAIADVLTGAAEPGGRLPTTFPDADGDAPILDTHPVDGVHTYAEGPLIGYRLWALGDAVPAYPFGHGLGYTTWSYDALDVTAGTDGLSVGVRLTNTGERRGREVVQVYLEPEDGTLFGSPEPARLVGYASVEADAGAVAEVRIDVGAATLSRWDAQADGWTVVPGTYRVHAGPDSATLRLGTDVAL